MAEVIIVKDEAEAGEIYARSVADLIKAKPDAVLGLATGSSPLAAYQALAALVKKESNDVSQVRGFALDEYLGLPLTHPESYHSTIHRTVVEPLGLDPAKVHVPGSSLASGTRVKTLAERTRIDNARFFNDDVNQVPMHCITQGIGTILKARHLVLLAFGAGKAEAIAETVEGGVSAFCPASALQLHPHATIIVDEAAASRLRHKGYYKYAFAHKPSWQGI